MDIRIGIVQSMKELEVELPEEDVYKRQDEAQSRDQSARPSSKSPTAVDRQLG